MKQMRADVDSQRDLKLAKQQFVWTLWPEQRQLFPAEQTSQMPLPVDHWGHYHHCSADYDPVPLIYRKQALHSNGVVSVMAMLRPS